MQMVNRAGRIVFSDPLAEAAGRRAAVETAREGGAVTFQNVTTAERHKVDPERRQSGVGAGVTGDHRYRDATRAQLLDGCECDGRGATALNAIVIDDNYTVYWSRHGRSLAPG